MSNVPSAALTQRRKEAKEAAEGVTRYLKSYTGYYEDKKAASKYVEEIWKTFSTENVSQNMIIPQVSKLILDLGGMVHPEWKLLKFVKSAEKTNKFIYPRRETRPRPGRVTGEKAETNEFEGTYTENEVVLKILRSKFKITDYSEEVVTRTNAEQELQFEILEFLYEYMFLYYYGNSKRDPYEFDGMNAVVTTNRFNLWDTSNGEPTLQFDFLFLNNALEAAAKGRQKGMPGKPHIVMSYAMVNLLSELQKSKRLYEGLGMIKVDPGLMIPTYNGVPIIISDFVGDHGAPVMGTVTASTAGTGGELSDGTYHFWVTKFILDTGLPPKKAQESAAKYASITISAGNSTQTITLSWDDQEDAYFYRVYYGTNANIWEAGPLIEKSAFVRDSNGKVTGYATDILITTTTKHASVTNLPTGEMPPSRVTDLNGNPASAEEIRIVDFDPIGIGEVAYRNRLSNAPDAFFGIEKLARTDAFTEWMASANSAPTMRNPQSSAIIRGVRSRLKSSESLP